MLSLRSASRICGCCGRSRRPNAERACSRNAGPIDIRVTTTPDVVKVTSGNGSRSGALTQRAPGVFTSQATLPHIGADLIVKHIKLHLSATTAAGTSVSVDAPVTIK